MFKNIRTTPEIIEYLKELSGAKTDSDVARLIGLTAQALHNHIKRGTMPLDSLLTFCLKEGFSLEGVLFTDGPAFGSKGVILDDPKTLEIIDYLKNYPDDRDVIHEMVRTKCSMRKAAGKFLKGF